MKMLGQKIKGLRKVKGYSQQEMADLLEVKKITYFKYESGEIEVPLSKLLKISEILNVTPNDLLGFEKEIGMKEKKDFYENCLRNDRATLVQIKENGDKYNDFYYPVLKNYLEDIIVFDVNGNLYKNTGKYRKLCFQSNIKKIDLYETDSICFNPLSYLNLENIKDFTDVLVMNCLGETERTNKVKFLSAVIKQFYFEIRIKELDLDINFKTILDYIRSFGKVKGISISTEFKISNSHKYFNETDRTYFEKIKLINKNDDEELIKKGHVYVLQTPLFRVRNKRTKIKNKQIIEEQDAKRLKGEKKNDLITIYCYTEEERINAIEALGPDPEITRFKGLGDISPDEFAHFIGPDMRLEQVTLHKNDQVKNLLEYYMGKNTMERQNFIIDNLVIEEDLVDEIPVE